MCGARQSHVRTRADSGSRHRRPRPEARDLDPRGDRLRVVVTGAAGLLGREVCLALMARGDEVVGIDNFSRLPMFGIARARRDKPRCTRFVEADYRAGLPDGPIDGVIHCAAQTSHPRSIAIPVEDFEVNAVGTLHLLEQVRQLSPRTPHVASTKPRLVYVGSAKIYGERVDDRWPLVENSARYHYADPRCEGIDEACPVGDQTTLTPMGVSKLAADLYCQQFARLYSMPIVVLRPGCFTGPDAMAVEEQNWLPYLVSKIAADKPFTVYGYRGKQLRDMLHVTDLAAACVLALDRADRLAGQVYNVGGGITNAISILEAARLASEVLGTPVHLRHADKRPGDWCVFVTDNRKAIRDLGWRGPRVGVAATLSELCDAARLRRATAAGATQ